MACLKRRRWTVVLTMIALLMFSLNILFLIDLTINHQAHSHLIGVLQDKSTGGGWKGIWSGKEHAIKKFYNVEVLSSKEKVEIIIGDKVYKSESALGNERGIHVGVLNQATGDLMATGVFDTYKPGAENDLVTFINSLSDGRILCLAIKDEGTFSLKDAGRNLLSALGSRLSDVLSWRDMWALVTTKGGEVLGEDIGKSASIQEWGNPVRVKVSIPILDSIVECDWPQTNENKKRQKFCSKYEGYGSLCHCAKPLPLPSKAPPLIPNNVANVPITVIASNRPLYLFTMLRRLLSVAGANSSMITVFIDGFFNQPKDVAELFNIRAVQHEPKSQKNGRISQHYKASLAETFDLYPRAKYIIIIEEDLEVSPDFLGYFSQTIQLMEEDDSIYCVSAWNDQGYEHSSQDPALLYRVETMPGLGWLLKKKLFKEELEPHWPGPDKLWDWDMWMRLGSVRKGRECVIPDISRTFHFGASGLNMNPYFHDRYFKNHALNAVPSVKLKNVHSLTKDNYELILHGLFREGSVLDHNKDPCSKTFIPNTKGKVYTLYINMTKSDHYEHWIRLASCFHLWDLDARGFHKGLWRFWIKENHVMVVGHPYSPYAAKYKPLGIVPFSFSPKKS